MRVLGWDIGGANIKAGLVEVSNGVIASCRTSVQYLPLWKGGAKRLSTVLQEVQSDLSRNRRIDGVGVTMTAELSDVFESKRKGVEYVLRHVEEVSGGVKLLVVDYNGGLLSEEEALQDHLKVSGANWAATAKVLSQIFEECLLIDVGSTTTDIIPILNHEIAAEGKTDTARLATGELVYTGALRSSVPSIVHTVPLKEEEIGVVSEHFALSADIHLLLGNISRSDYSTETADGRGTSRRECLSRLARTVCADLDMIGKPELIRMASYIYGKQVEKIREGLDKVWNRLTLEQTDRRNFPVVTTGLGGEFLGREAASKTGFTRFFDLKSTLSLENSQAAAAVSIALLIAASRGEKMVWPTY